MSMSHQVVITFDVDENKVMQAAEVEAGRQVATRVLEEALGKGYTGSYTAKRNAEHFLREEIKNMLVESKDEIIGVAVKELVLSLSRAKAVREKVQEAINES